MLIGNVGKEPVVHYYDADQAVAQVSFATTEKGYTLACKGGGEVCTQGRPTLCGRPDPLSTL